MRNTEEKQSQGTEEKQLSEHRYFRIKGNPRVEYFKTGGSWSSRLMGCNTENWYAFEEVDPNGNDIEKSRKKWESENPCTTFQVKPYDPVGAHQIATDDAADHHSPIPEKFIRDAEYSSERFRYKNDFGIEKERYETETKKWFNDRNEKFYSYRISNFKGIQAAAIKYFSHVKTRRQKTLTKLRNEISNANNTAELYILLKNTYMDIAKTKNGLPGKELSFYKTPGSRLGKQIKQLINKEFRFKFNAKKMKDGTVALDIKRIPPYGPLFHMVIIAELSDLKEAETDPKLKAIFDAELKQVRELGKLDPKEYDTSETLRP